MRMPPRIAESSQRGTIPEQTAVHHSEYSGRDRLLSRRLVNHAILQPKRGQLQSDAVVDDCRNMLRSTEDIDYVNPLARLQDIGQMIKVGNGLFAEEGAAARRDWNDSVAKALELLRDTVAGS
jgi:hypothetical protein